MNTRTPPMQDATLIDALNQATSLELYQLSMLLERLITDPRRIVAVRKDLHLGQVVRFYDGRRDTMREGRIIEMRDAQVTLHDTQQRVQWKLPYAAIEPPQSAVQPDPATPPAQPTPPASPRPTRADFARGDKVSSPIVICRRTSASSPAATPRPPPSTRARPPGACPTDTCDGSSTSDCHARFSAVKRRGRPDRHSQVAS